MDDQEAAKIAVSVVGGGAAWQAVRYFLGYFKLRSEKDGQIIARTLEYSDALRRDIDEMKAELSALRKENAELKEQIHSLSAKLENLYERNLELLQMDKAHREHIESCVVVQRLAMEKNGQ